MHYSQGVIPIRTKGGGGLFVMLLEVFPNIIYAKRPFLFSEILRLWDYPGDLTQRMNKYQLRLLWTYIYSTPPANFFTSALEAVMKSQPLDQHRNI